MKRKKLVVYIEIFSLLKNIRKIELYMSYIYFAYTIRRQNPAEMVTVSLMDASLKSSDKIRSNPLNKKLEDL